MFILTNSNKAPGIFGVLPTYPQATVLSLIVFTGGKKSGILCYINKPVYTFIQEKLL